MSLSIEAGHAHRLGAHVAEGGVNFAVFSAHAERIEVCLFDPQSGAPGERFDLPERTGDVWHGFCDNLGAGTHYGLRAHGPWAPGQGHRFNPAKLLIDPYARALSGPLQFHPTQVGHDPASAAGNLTPDANDSAAHVARGVVVAPATGHDWQRPDTDHGETFIWEAHVRGLTMARAHVPGALRGTFDALGEPWLVEHLAALGVTAIELLPVQTFVDERFLLERGLRNYWGYNPVNFFTPEWRYLGPAGRAGFRAMVKRFHAAGIEVILDVVYNHTAEGDETGPTLSYRGLDNASYYALERGTPERYVNDTGCGNTLAVHHPFVLRLVLDSLRYWHTEMGVDGFRFDLATTLGREPGGFDPGCGFLDALRQDPVLSRCRLIAEPWDLGPGGYQAGAFPPEFAEWNDIYRDTVRRFWKHDAGAAPDLAHALLGSAGRFDRPGSGPRRSVNFVASHDGFTLADLTRYRVPRNRANGENNRDGHQANHADGCGVDGPTNTAEVLAARSCRQRNLLFTLLVSQGTPMLLAGDEWGNSQGGNNNAYCQDNPTGWLDWDNFDRGLFAFTMRLVALRRAFPVLRQRCFLHGEDAGDRGLPNVTWLALDGGLPSWQDAGLAGFALLLRDASAAAHDVLIAFNAGSDDVDLSFPAAGPWCRRIDTRDPGILDHVEPGLSATIAGDSAAFFTLERTAA